MTIHLKQQEPTFNGRWRLWTTLALHVQTEL